MEWRQIVGYEGLYEVSEYGDVRSLVKRGRYTEGQYIKGRVIKKGYAMVRIYNENGRADFFRHRLVARAFIGELPEGLQCHHKDGNKLNNHYSNLEYVTQSENIRHAIDTGLLVYHQGNEIWWAKLTDDIVRIARMRRNAGEGVKKLAREYGVNHKTMSHAIKGITWKHVK